MGGIGSRRVPSRSAGSIQIALGGPGYGRAFWTGAYTGADTGTPIGASRTSATGTGTLSTAPSVVPTKDGSMVVVVSGDNGDTSNTLSIAGSNPTFTAEIPSSVVLGVLDGTLTFAAATGNKSFTNNSASGNDWVTSMFVINPTPPAALTVPSVSLLIRERAPLRLHATVDTPAQTYYRWGPDAHDAREALSGLSFSTAMPGGFDQANLVLARDPSLDYSDLEELSTVTIRGAGGRIAWQGRLETSPRTSGDQMTISPGLVGWQAHLLDDTSARQIYCDIDLSVWQGASNKRQINWTNAATDEDDGSTGADWTSQVPALLTGWSSSWTRQHISELWYDAKGLPLRTLSLSINDANTAVIDPANPNWQCQMYLATDDVDTVHDATVNLIAAGLVARTLNATAQNRTWAYVRLIYTAAGGSDGITYQLYWSNVVILGWHNVIYHVGADVAHSGVLASDVEADALARWAPKLRFSTGVNGTIQPSTYWIPQSKYVDPTTVSAIVKDVNQYELRDWAVWEGPTYYSNAFGARGRTWQVRVRNAKLQETGPQASRLFNGVIVTYTDVTGITRQVGPPGSGDGTSATEDASLSDLDPLNPVNELGIRKWATLQMQTGTSVSAIQVGKTFLQYQKNAEHVGPGQPRRSRAGYERQLLAGLHGPGRRLDLVRRCRRLLVSPDRVDQLRRQLEDQQHPVGLAPGWDAGPARALRRHADAGRLLVNLPKTKFSASFWVGSRPRIGIRLVYHRRGIKWTLNGSRMLWSCP